MANSAIITARNPVTVVNHVSTAVFVKRAWADDWTWVPNIEPVRAVEACAPSVGEASFKYQFGEIQQHFDTDFGFYRPLLVQGAYVMIVAYNEFAPRGWPVWIGVIQEETANIYGSAFPAAEQSYEALSIEHLLDRNMINGAYCDGGEYIERAVAFNKKNGNGVLTKGNRSAEKIDGCYLFSDDGEQWSNLQIIEYLVERYLGDGITFEVTGATDPLDNIFEEHQLYGRSVLDAINNLVDHRYGLGWRILVPVAPGGTCQIHVFSQLQYPVQIGDVTVPANPMQAYVTNQGTHLVDLSLGFSATHQYDSVNVYGQPILVCGSFSYADETLERGWTDEEETAYNSPGHDDETEDDTARRAEKFDRVYQAHRVPKDWDGACGDGEGGSRYNAHPQVEDDCTINYDETADFWQSERKFERNIPIEIETLDPDAPQEFRAGFAVVKQLDGTYNFAEKAWGEDETTRFPGNMTMLDREMGVALKGSINHVYGLNHFPEDALSAITPAFNYEDIIVTAAFYTDRRLRYQVQVPGQYITETGRTATIILPDAEYWVILPNTVTDIVDGALTRDYTDYEVVRDDSAEIRQMAALAQLWFATARATVAMRVKVVSPLFGVGTLIGAAAASWHATQIGTVVSQRVWDFRANTTDVTTGYDELAFSGDVFRKKKKMAKK